MMMNGLYIAQSGQDYVLITPQGIRVAYIACPPDGQMMGDAVTLKAITKFLGKRWGVPNNQGNSN